MLGTQKPEGYASVSAEPEDQRSSSSSWWTRATVALLLLCCCVLAGLLWQEHASSPYKPGKPVDKEALERKWRNATATSTRPPHMLVYAQGCCEKAKVRACKSALKHGFGTCQTFGLDDLPSVSALSPEGYAILTREHARGAGYWLWKPLLIWQELLAAKDGDIIGYMDADSELMSDARPLLALLGEQDIVGFFSGETETNATKTDVLLMLNATEFRDTMQLYAGLMFFRRSWRTLGFVSQWLSYCQDKRWMTNIRNTLLPSPLEGYTNHPGFFVHRNDQAIFSLLYKKYGFRGYPDPSDDFSGAREHPYPKIWQFHHKGKE